MGETPPSLFICCSVCGGPFVARCCTAPVDRAKKPARIGHKWSRRRPKKINRALRRRRATYVDGGAVAAADFRVHPAQDHVGRFAPLPLSLRSGRTSRHVRKVPLNETARAVERCAQGGGWG